MNLRHQQGQGLAEYAMLISLVAMIVIFIVMMFGSQLQDVYQTIWNTLGHI